MRKPPDVSRVGPCVALLIAALATRDVHAQGSIIGRVTDEALSPIGDAELVVRSLNAGTRTDSTGRFHFRGLPPGIRRIDVRRLGFVPASIEVQVPTRDSIVVHVRLRRRAQLLPAVPIEDSAVDYRLKDFERRRSSGVGQFLTAAELAPERSKPLGDAVGRLRGTYVVRSGSTACLTTTRGSQSFQHSATGRAGIERLEVQIVPSPYSWTAPPGTPVTMMSSST
jgi:hypothetical protein